MRPNWPLRVAAEYLLVLAGILAASLSPWLWLPAAWFVGTRLHALAIIGHWASHGIAPDWLEMFTLLPLGVDPWNYREFHGWHHAAVSQVHRDPEAQIVSRFMPRWQSVRWFDSVLDLLGLHIDEGVAIMRHVASPETLAFAAVINVIAFAAFGPAALVVPAGLATGFIFAHRLRARTEHDHIHRPGETFVQTTAPACWKRVLYLPHYTWLHAQHHWAPATTIPKMCEMKLELS